LAPSCRPPPAPAPQQEAVAAARLEKAGRAWDGALAVIDETRKKQAQAPGLAEPAKKALATPDRKWDGLAAHRGYPLVSLDNNIAETAIRGPVVTRKNARGSHNGDTARNAAVIWTVTATARMAGLNELTYLTATRQLAVQPRPLQETKASTATKNLPDAILWRVRRIQSLAPPHQLAPRRASAQSAAPAVFSSIAGQSSARTPCSCAMHPVLE
jgi:Transposase IS66 family